MDPLTIAAICTLVLKNEAASTAVPPGTNCAQIDRNQQANAARANARVDDTSDREAIGRVAYHEAGNQGDRGIAAVVYTIINRVGSGRFGRTVSEVLNAPRQFEPVTRVGGNWTRLPPAPDAKRARIDAIVGLALKGDLADETGGALYFQNPRIVASRERAGTVSRGLTNFGGQTPSVVIGDHSFYRGRDLPRVRGVGQPILAPGFSSIETPGSATLASSPVRGLQEQVSSVDQKDYISAGGAIFGTGGSDAFDPSGQIESPVTQPDQQVAMPLGIEASVVSSAGNALVRAGGAVSDTQPPAPQPAPDIGGMFVLADGRTSAAPQ